MTKKRTRFEKDHAEWSTNEAHPVACEKIYTVWLGKIHHIESVLSGTDSEDLDFKHGIDYVIHLPLMVAGDHTLPIYIQERWREDGFVS